MTIESAMQFVKVGFSYRVRHEHGYWREVWQRGFRESRIEDRERFVRHGEYIAANPVKAGLADPPEEYPYCFTCLAKRKTAGAEALDCTRSDGTAEAMP